MTTDQTLVLVCNAHIDPVWLWPWEEGLAQALATFRAAADLCEEFDGFVFCHNEALLYQWVEEHEPALFARIQHLVRGGRWHIMGGWYLQPDCNLPSGESFVRQVLAGKRYFLDRFGVEPTVAANLDPFGHTRGLVQILRRSGYAGYLFCRPDRSHLELPEDDFVWVGYDGSEVLAHRAADHYNSELGKARQKVERWLAANQRRRHGLLLWGVGNHGGGPSRVDLTALGELITSRRDRRIAHGRPEDYVARLLPEAPHLPRVASDLNPWAVGCYTTMTTVKQAHRRLEGALYATEKLLAGAVLNGLMAWPRHDLQEALEDLLFAEFHDILPGSSVAEVEQQALRRLAHGHEIVARLRARAFFAQLSGELPAAEGEYPVFVCNPYPFPVATTVVSELQPPEPNQDRAMFLQPELTDATGQRVPVQIEKESCNIQVDQRKRIVFRAMLAPSRMSRFACRLRLVPRPAPIEARPLTKTYVHRTADCQIEIDAGTGLIARYCAGGSEYLRAGACRPLVMRDSPDPWGMLVRSFRDLVGEFRLMAPGRAAAFAGVSRSALAPVRVIEQGPVRTVVEALFEYGHSALCLRYKLPGAGCEVEIEVRVYWNEKDRMLKLSFPTPFAGGRTLGQVAYGVEEASREGEELIAHQWIAQVSPDGSHALTVVNDSTYGFDVAEGELRLSLLRSAAHAGHPVDPVTPIVRQDRFEPRIDQGERTFRFWLAGGPARDRLEVIDREAAVRNEPPMALCAFPPGSGQQPLPAVVLSDAAVQLAAMKMAEDEARLILRLFEPTGTRRTTTVSIPPLGLLQELTLAPFEIRTLAVDLATRAVAETDLLERPIGRPE